MPETFLSQLTGSFAMPAAENPTVAMVEAAYQYHGLDWRYINCEVSPDNLGAAVAGAKAMGWAGFNCSLPHKVKVIDHIDGLGQSAKIMGAVNCVVRRDGRLIGENTDGKGFAASLDGIVEPRGKRMVIFGAGGAARAIAVELALLGVRAITVVNRDPKRGETLAELIASRTPAQAELVAWDRPYAIPDSVDIAVNATSIGLYPDVEGRLDIVEESLRPGLVVADVIPNPPRTRLTETARAHGCIVVDGLGMLVNQGVIGIKYWTGIDVDAGVMRRKLEELFGA